jgi:heme/copper-type cytochrome/quinol oxidase subunit 2
MFNIFK